MTITLLNLDRSPERLRRFMRINAHLSNVERFSAVDGRLLSLETLRQQGLLEGSPKFTPGSIGAFLSHLASWERAVESGKPQTVAEDDAIFAYDFEETQSRLMQAAGSDWDFILWGWNFDSFIWLDLIPGVSPAVVETFQDRLRLGLVRFQDQRPMRCLIRLLHFFGTVCYSVSPKGARRLRDFCVPMRDMLIPFPGFDVAIEARGTDSTMNAVVRDLNAFACLPPPVITENRHETSTIQAQ